ncbi:hypothetical protein XI09_00940 [Bradyrhizobium sp. CCBAU 11386]|nr:hypothetical protein [Bradyrhizobium sp. CCBAU 11386]
MRPIFVLSKTLIWPPSRSAIIGQAARWVNGKVTRSATASTPTLSQLARDRLPMVQNTSC